MATQANPFVSVDEYLEREANSLDRHEYLNGEIFLMAGWTLEHSAIATNVSASEGTENYDRGQKFELYRQIESFREYLVIAQDRVYVEHHRRDESLHTQWTMRVFTGREDVISLSAVPAQLRMVDIYRKVLLGA